LAKKKKAKEDKRKDAVKHRQAVAIASEQLVEAFKQFTTPQLRLRMQLQWWRKKWLL
jgi:hypothetical protein